MELIQIILEAFILVLSIASLIAVVLTLKFIFFGDDDYERIIDAHAAEVRKKMDPH